MKTILISGGAGYIGSHTAQTLIDQSYNVVIIDNLSTGFIEAVPQSALFVQGDVCDEDFLKNVFKKYSIDAVVHFAAMLNVKESTQIPGKYYEKNMNGILTLLKVMNENHVKKIVFSSTASVYGEKTQNRPILETDPISPLSPYGKSKYFCEQIIEDFQKSFGIQHIILRYFNVAGANDNLSNGQRTLNAYHLVHLASQTALGLHDTLKIFGGDYPTADGTCIRDYIHVQDLAEIHELALQQLFKKEESHIFNCGYGLGFSVASVIDSFQRTNEVKLKTEMAERRAGDAAYLVCDPSKLKKILKWIPKRNQIDLICKSAYLWEKKYQITLSRK